MTQELFYTGVQIWIAAMLTIQSYILYRLLPQIKGIHKNSNFFNIFKPQKKSNNIAGVSTLGLAGSAIQQAKQKELSDKNA